MLERLDVPVDDVALDIKIVRIRTSVYVVGLSYH